jgi:hypothetical protein
MARTLRAILLAALCALGAPRPSAAQLTADIGAAVADTTTMPLGGRDIAAPPELKLHAAAALTDKWTVAAVFSVGRDTHYLAGTTGGEYGATFTRYQDPAAAATPYVSIGAAGWHAETRNGLRWSDGMASMLPTVGAGLRARLDQHLLLDAGAEMIMFLVFPVQARLTVGVSVPFGSPRAPARAR